VRTRHDSNGSARHQRLFDDAVSPLGSGLGNSLRDCVHDLLFVSATSHRAHKDYSLNLLREEKTHATSVKVSVESLWDER